MIPTNEQPYPLPVGWQWTRQRNICELSQGKKLSDASFPYLDVKYLRGMKEKSFADNGNYIESGTKIILVDGENSGEIFTTPEGGYMGSTFRVLNISECVNADFFQYFASTKKDFYKKNKRGSAIPHLNKNLFYSMPFPLPPLDEQQRIVALLDELFADLDAAKALAQAVVDGSQLRRAAILYKAFTGELTKLWRGEHGTALDSWQRRTVASVCKNLAYGTSKKSKSSGKMIVLRMGNLQSGEIDWNNLAYSDDESDIKKYLLSTGDVLFNRTNSAELVGKTSIYRGEYPAIYAGYLIKLDYDRDVLSGEYLNYVLNSPAAKEYCNHVKTDGVNQSNINAKKIGAYVIPLPPPEEQKEIVRLLDDLLGREQQTKNLAGKNLEHIEILRKSILSRVFRGELVLGEQF